MLDRYDLPLIARSLGRLMSTFVSDALRPIALRIVKLEEKTASMGDASRIADLEARIPILPDVIRHTALWSSDFPLPTPKSAESHRPVQLPTIRL